MPSLRNIVAYIVNPRLLTLHRHDPATIESGLLKKKMGYMLYFIPPKGKPVNIPGGILNKKELAELGEILTIHYTGGKSMRTAFEAKLNTFVADDSKPIGTLLRFHRDGSTTEEQL